MFSQVEVVINGVFVHRIWNDNELVKMAQNDVPSLMLFEAGDLFKRSGRLERSSWLLI